MKTRKTRLLKSKRGFRANGLILPLALRPGLVFGGKLSLGDLGKFSTAMAALCLVAWVGIFVGFFSGQNVLASSVTLTVPSSALSLDVAPGSGAVFKKSSAETISVATDSSYGYSLSIASKTGNDLVNETNKISSILSPLNESDFQNSGSANTWGYMPSKLNGSTNLNFLPGPTIESTNLDTIESSSDGTDYDITLATKIDSTLPAGNYHNSFILTAMSNDPPIDNLMQGQDGYGWTGCEDLAEEETVELTDIRDNQTYSVAKLKDGNCWMTQNLRIVDKTLTPEDSDVDSNFVLPSSISSDFMYEYIPQVHIDTDGGYYNWLAAIANTYPSSGEAKNSICPKGWRLPTSTDIDHLVSTYLTASAGDASAASNMLRSSPANFLLSGLFYFRSLSYRGSFGTGYYWSSTLYPSGSYYAYILHLDTTSARTNDISYDNASGFSVRCITRVDAPREPININDTLQNVKNWGDDVQSLRQPVIARDSRDNKEYSVARLRDGNLWLTQNLRIVDKTLTPEDSDVDSNFVLPSSISGGFDSYDTPQVHTDVDGNYYNWAAATAGTNPSSGEAKSSICPKNWRLPTLSELNSLISSYDSGSAASNALRSSPANFMISGYFYMNSIHNSNSDGWYWSSTAGDSKSAYYLDLGISSVMSNGCCDVKKYGYSVRCIAY